MRASTTFAVGVLLVSASTVLLSQEIKVDIPYEKFVLKNGLTLLVHEDRKAPVVAVNVWYHVGSKNEKRGKTGFAHLFEHLMFNGTEHFNTDYFKALERIGATDLNGTTNNDRTNYFQNVPTSALDTALWMESERMGHLLGAIDQAKLDEQRGVVQNEKRQGENEPYGLVEQVLTENTYPVGHPYSWTVIGSMEDLNAAALDDVREWFKAYYGPNNAVIVLAGDIDAKTAREKVEKYFGAIPPGPPVTKHDVWIAKMQGTKRVTMQDRVPQTLLLKLWNVPQRYSRDGEVLSLAAGVLGQGRNSRLYRRLVLKDQTATSASAFAAMNEIGGQFMVQAMVRPGADPAAVERAMDEEVARFLSEGPQANELKAVQTRNVASWVRRVERVGGFGGKSDVLANGEVYARDPAAYKKSLALLQSATTVEVKEASNRWLADGVFVLRVDPFPKLDVVSKNDVDRSKLPEPGPAPEARFPRIQRATLSNGLKLSLVERHEIPVVQFRLLFDAGYAADQFTLPGTASMTAGALNEGTRKRTLMQITEESDMLGAFISGGSNLDTTSVSLNALKANLDASLELFADVVLNPAFPEQEIARRKKQVLASIQQEKEQPFAMALRVMPKLMFGSDHAYGNPLTGSGTEDSVAKMTRADLEKFHQTWFRPNNATLIVVGDVTLAEIQPKIEKLLSEWKPGQVPAKSLKQVAHKEASRVYLIDRPGAQQSVILAGHVAPPRNNPDEIPAQVMNTLLGGKFTSRINMNLREDKHWSYGAGSAFQDAKGQSPFIVYAPVQTDKTKESMQEVLKELRGIIRDKPVTDEELSTTKDNLTLQLPGQRETMGAISGNLAEMITFSLPQDYFDTYTAKVRGVSRQDVSTVAEKLLRPDKLTWVVVGDRSKIEAGVKELNFGPLEYLDADGNPVRP